MHSLILGRSVGLKKNLKKNHKKSRNRRTWYPGTTLKVNFHITGLTKCTICCKKFSCFSPWCYYDHFSDGLKELFLVKNGLTYYVITFFFLKMTKIWVGHTMLNGEKKEDGLMNLLECDWHGPLPLGKVGMYIQLLPQ